MSLATPRCSLLHPLAEVELEKYCTVPEAIITATREAECVLWGEKLCVIVESKSEGKDIVPSGWLKISKLIVFSPDFTSGTVTSTLPESDCALTTYHSKLVLVGGSSRNVETSWILSNKLWVSEDGINWESSLPPMPTKRMSPVAVNTRNPEYLVVAGGLTLVQRQRWSEEMETTLELLDIVEVFANDQWSRFEPLPIKYDNMCHTIHNGTLFLTGDNFTISATTKMRLKESITFCKLGPLIAAIEGKHSGEDLWQYSDRTLSHIRGGSKLAFHGGQLITAGNTFGETTIHAYSPLLPAWIHVGTLPMIALTTFVSPAGELIVVALNGTGLQHHGITVFKLSVKVSYDANTPFTMLSLYKLEAAGMPIVTSLTNNLEHLCKLCKIRWLPDRLYMYTCNFVITKWRNKNSKSPPTWKLLFDFMKELGLEELAREIEAYLSDKGVQSLRELSMSVITSALLQQWSLKADELDTRLPDYVPTRVKHSITCLFKKLGFKPLAEELIVMYRQDD